LKRAFAKPAWAMDTGKGIIKSKRLNVMKTKLPNRIALLAAAVLCFFSLCDSTRVFGQDYVPLIDASKQWNVMVTWYAYGGSPAIKNTINFWIAENDTIINDTVYNTVIANNPNSTGYFPNGTVGFIREDTLERKVYFRDYEATEPFFMIKDRLLYDFSIESGDTVEVFGMYTCPEFWNTYVVSSTSSVSLLNGSERKVWNLSPIGGYAQNNDQWIEGIGSLNGMPFPACYQLQTISFSLDLLCYFEGETKLYALMEDTCEVYWTSSVSELAANPIHCYPNPARDELNISLPDNFQDCHTISIFDLSGGLLLQEVHCGNEFRVNVRNLKPGLYFLKVVSQRGVFELKFVKF
jgi:hypothetical protein